jgi:hypothetical protein
MDESFEDYAQSNYHSDGDDDDDEDELLVIPNNS